MGTWCIFTIVAHCIEEVTFKNHFPEIKRRSITMELKPSTAL